MFVTRLISGIILLIIAIFTMVTGGPCLAVTLLLISLVAYRELTKALLCAEEDGKLNGLEILGMIGVVGYYMAVYLQADSVYLLMCLVAVFLAEMFCYVITFPKFKASQVMGAVFSFIYGPMMLSFVYLTRILPEGLYTVWLILISSWGCDTCAYAVGKLIGKKKIFPTLSPHKSLEGCFGGVAGAALIGALYGYFVLKPVAPERPIVPIMAFICAAGAVMSMIGDLAASAIKRNHNIKDYGKLIPGHGGIMDRFDSMIVTAPMVYFLALILLQM